MKKFAPPLVLLPSFAFTQALPSYVGVNSSTDPVGPIMSPFSTGTLYNSVAYSPLNPTTNPITRLTLRHPVAPVDITEVRRTR
jgi:hypothetical protein